ncbi:MAG: LacI family transcriptional regulator [Lentisphaerae bacterium]|nr:LacI family transcriptional regulator [Lentisphaerota bacterium]
MHPQRCTLRNIADHCQVSTAVVSAVLNGRTERISCSETTRNKILDAARKLNYTPNALARSMREKKVPLVGVFLRQHPQWSGLLDNTNVRMLSAATECLNQCGYETIFVPFTDSKSQFERMKSLMFSGLLGGVITCIINEEAEDICNLLKDSGLPYLILGNPPVQDAYCLYYRDTISCRKYQALAASRNLHHCFSVAPAFTDKKHVVFRKIPYPDHFIWNAPEVPEETVRCVADDSLFVIMGMSIYRQLTSCGFVCKNFVIAEAFEDQSRVPENFDAVFVRQLSAKAEHIAEIFCPWLLENRKPDTFHKVLEMEEHHFEFRFNNI